MVISKTDGDWGKPKGNLEGAAGDHNNSGMTLNDNQKVQTEQKKRQADCLQVAKRERHGSGPFSIAYLLGEGIL